MHDLTRERRAALRDQVQLYGFTKSGMKHAELMALFEAADERDRLRAEVQRLEAEAEDSRWDVREALERAYGD